MDQPQDKNQDSNQNQDQNSGQTGEPEAHKIAADASAASDTMKDLPEVDAPRLDGAEAAEPTAEPAGEPARAHAAPMLVSTSDAVSEISDEGAPIELASAPQPRSFRFALLAATIALAAGLGAFVGALSAFSVARHDVADATTPRSADARGVLAAVKAEIAELNALKAGVETANRNSTAQLAKIGDRLASLEHAQVEPAARLALLAQTVDRLDKRANAAPDITGSIAKPAEPAAAPAAAATPAATTTILNDWIVRDVRNGRALVESRYGGIFVVGSGASLPGVGRVESVRRQDGAWIVVTAKGTITSER